MIKAPIINVPYTPYIKSLHQEPEWNDTLEYIKNHPDYKDYEVFEIVGSHLVLLDDEFHELGYQVRIRKKEMKSD